MPKNNKEKVETFSQTDLNELFNPVSPQARIPSILNTPLSTPINTPEQTPTSVQATIQATVQLPVQATFQFPILPHERLPSSQQIQPRVPLPAQLTVEIPIPASLAYQGLQPGVQFPVYGPQTDPELQQRVQNPIDTTSAKQGIQNSIKTRPAKRKPTPKVQGKETDAKYEITETEYKAAAKQRLKEVHSKKGLPNIVLSVQEQADARSYKRKRYWINKINKGENSVTAEAKDKSIAPEEAMNALTQPVNAANRKPKAVQQKNNNKVSKKKVNNIRKV